MILSREQATVWPSLTDAQREDLYESWRASSPELCAVEDLLGVISQGVWAASWLQDMEAVAWLLLHDPTEAAALTSQDYHAYCTGAELAGWLQQLRELTLDRGWYPLYDIPDSGWMMVGRVVSVEEMAAYVGP